jgi:hypothetical protein
MEESTKNKSEALTLLTRAHRPSPSPAASSKALSSSYFSLGDVGEWLMQWTPVGFPHHEH